MYSTVPAQQRPVLGGMEWKAPVPDAVCGSNVRVDEALEEVFTVQCRGGWWWWCSEDATQKNL